jgi:hypothetical protein
VTPHSYLSRRISRTRLIDTLSAGIGPPNRHSRDERSAAYRPAVERLPLLQGRPTSKSEWPRSNRNQWPTSFPNGWPTSPESASLTVLGHPQCQLMSATGEWTSDGFDAPDSLAAPGSPPCSFGRKAAVLSASANPASSVCLSERAWTPACAALVRE